MRKYGISANSAFNSYSVGFVFQLMTGLECGHRFCQQCWTGYLTTKIMDEGMGQTIACAAHGCDILVDDQTVM